MIYFYDTSSNLPSLMSTGLVKPYYGNWPMNISGETFTSKCECRKSDFISISQHSRKHFINVRSTDPTKTYKTTDTDVQSIMCDAYNVLRRGLNQKVIGFSLWGNEERYVALLKGYMTRFVNYLKCVIIIT